MSATKRDALSYLSARIFPPRFPAASCLSRSRSHRARSRWQLPCNSGISLLELEADDAVQQTVEALVDLSRDSLDMISLALTEQLERLAKVRSSFHA